MDTTLEQYVAVNQSRTFCEEFFCLSNNKLPTKPIWPRLIFLSRLLGIFDICKPLINQSNKLSIKHKYLLRKTLFHSTQGCNLFSVIALSVQPLYSRYREDPNNGHSYKKFMYTSSILGWDSPTSTIALEEFFKERYGRLVNFTPGNYHYSVS